MTRSEFRTPPSELPEKPCVVIKPDPQLQEGYKTADAAEAGKPGGRELNDGGDSGMISRGRAAIKAVLDS